MFAPRFRRHVAAAVAVVAVAGCSPVGASLAPTEHARATVVDLPGAADEQPTGPTPVDTSGLQDALDAIAAAFLAGDPDQLRPWLHDDSTPFGERWLERAANMAALPLASYTLELDASVPDLATDAVRGRYGEPAAVVSVLERHRIRGFDPDGSAVDDLYLTAIRTSEGWRIATDTDGRPLGLSSVTHLWDLTRVVATRRGRVLALHPPGAAGIDTVLDEAGRALATATDRWPVDWPRRVAIIVPADEDQLGDLLNVTFDLTNFIAFAIASPYASLGDYDLTGPRIVLNTDRFLQRQSSTRERILVHELTHIATRPVSGPFVPSWLEEGVAQALGEQQSTTGTGLVDALAPSGVQLPSDAQFTLGGRDRIYLSYQLAWSFVDWLRRTYGSGAVARFYVAAGEGSLRQAGTEAWHIDRAAREVFGRSMAELRDAWRVGR
jgi:hypothetical protein